MYGAIKIINELNNISYKIFPRLISVKIGTTKPKLITLKIAKIMQYKNPQMWIVKTPKIAERSLNFIFWEIFKIKPEITIAKINWQHRTETWSSQV